MVFYLAEAEKVAKKYKTRDPKQIAREKDIKVIYLSLQVVYGMSFSLDLYKFIVVNSNLPEDIQELVIAHELGHFVLHPQGNFIYILNQTMFYSKHEYQANMFAFGLQFGAELIQHESLVKELAAGPVDKLVKTISKWGLK